MAKKTTKKVNAKDAMKKTVNEILVKALTDNGYGCESGEEYGLTKSTVIVHGEAVDLQVKLISPKAGQERYQKVEEEEEE